VDVPDPPVLFLEPRVEPPRHALARDTQIEPRLRHQHAASTDAERLRESRAFVGEVVADVPHRHPVEAAVVEWEGLGGGGGALESSGSEFGDGVR